MKDVAKKIIYVLLIIVLPVFSLSCISEPKTMEIPMEPTKGPEAKVTTFSDSLKMFGLMMEIHRSQPIKVMVKDITDKTGASVSTGSEIQQNITEIVKSTLNSMGENVVFIEYDPEFVQAMQQTGYSDFGDKLIPDVVVTGAITEFDRALDSWDKGMDAGAEVDFAHVKKFLPSQTVSAEISDQSTVNKARITIDFNLKDFKTLGGIPRMTIVNAIEVQKGQRKQEFGITLFGPTFGQKGSRKIVQGRHDAVRQVVQSGLIQLIGRYAAVPYWKVFGEDTVQDDVVMKSWLRGFPKLDDTTRISMMQEKLFLLGYDVNINGKVDDKTKAAFSDFKSKNNLPGGSLNAETFLKIYFAVPINESTFARAQSMGSGGGGTVITDSSQGSPQQHAAVQQDQPADDFGKAGNMLTQAYGHFKQNDYKNAADLFEQSIKASPTPVAYYYVALSYQSLQNKKAAIARLEEGVQQFGNDFPLWKALGMSYYEVGDEQRAKSAFKNALALKPNDKQVKFFMDRIR
ncbi:MAG: tetratricopeptide repeat protein [Nitrospira sp.]|nr:tetratricopeptide repeat protein [Nitrospira sp.]